MKKQKGITLIALLIIIVILLFFLYLLFGSSNNTTKTSLTTIKEDRSTYIAKCTTIDYDSLARNPNQYKGNYYKFTGEVIQVMEDNNALTLRVNITPKKYEYVNETYYEDTILVAYEYSSSAESRILEDDIITIYGQSIGTYTYESVFGSSITVPAIVAEYIDIN